MIVSATGTGTVLCILPTMGIGLGVGQNLLFLSKENSLMIRNRLMDSRRENYWRRTNRQGRLSSYSSSVTSTAPGHESSDQPEGQLYSHFQYSNWSWLVGVRPSRLTIRGKKNCQNRWIKQTSIFNNWDFNFLARNSYLTFFFLTFSQKVHPFFFLFNQ